MFFLPQFYEGVFYLCVPVVLLVQLCAASQHCPDHLGQLFPNFGWSEVAWTPTVRALTICVFFQWTWESPHLPPVEV